MSISRYLIANYLISTGLFYNLYIPARTNIIAESGSAIPTWPLLLMIPAIAAMFVWRGVRPMAEEVPPTSRESFWSYRKANRAIWMMAAIAVLGWATYFMGIR